MSNISPLAMGTVGGVAGASGIGLAAAAAQEDKNQGGPSLDSVALGTLGALGMAGGLYGGYHALRNGSKNGGARPGTAGAPQTPSTAAQASTATKTAEAASKNDASLTPREKRREEIKQANIARNAQNDEEHSDLSRKLPNTLHAGENGFATQFNPGSQDRLERQYAKEDQIEHKRSLENERAAKATPTVLHADADGVAHAASRPTIFKAR